MIVLPSRIRAAMLEHADAGAPEEVCGVLGGTFERDRSRADAYDPVTNVADRPRVRYRIDPTELLEVLTRIETRGQRVVGFFHSHPRSPLEPSGTDAAGAAWPDRSYVIGRPESSERDEAGPASTTGTAIALRSWRWRSDDGFERERIVGSGEPGGDESDEREYRRRMGSTATNGIDGDERD